MEYKLFFLAYVLINLIVPESDGSFDSERDAGLKIFHNYDLKSDEFIECGNYNLDLSDTEIKQQCITSNIRSFIQENSHLASANYRMKMLFKLQDKEHTFYTFIPFGQLVNYDYQYSFTIALDHDMLPISIAAKASNSTPKSPLGDNAYIDVFFKNMDTGPQPDTATFIHKMEKEREAKEKGANQDNRSFLAKYWIYILPLLIFAVLSGSVNADGSGSQR